MLKNIYKYLIIIIIVIIFSLAFTGSHIVQSVDDLAYTVALGIDVGDSEDLKVTFQFTMPAPSGEGGSGQSSPSVIDSVEANSIDSAISFMNAYVSKEINLSHCKVIVISEEVAKRGIAKEIFSLMNKVQIRPDNHVIISTCSAQKYIESVSPSLENLVTKFYEILPRSGDYTGYTVNGKNPYIIYCTYKDDYYDRIYRFKSDNLWTDPSLILQSGDDIKVYVDEKDYSCYHVDIESIFKGKIIDYT